MSDAESTSDAADLLAETIDYLTLEPTDDTGAAWIGSAPDWFGEVLFGGFVIAQAIIAATRDTPEGRRLHSLHAYFLRPVIAGTPIAYELRPVRDGRSFSSRHVAASQRGKPTLEMSCSFTADTDGYVYDLPNRDTKVPPPDELPVTAGPGPWIASILGPTPATPDGTRESTHRMWFRIPTDLPDDVHLHTALLGFATDWTETGGRPLHLAGDMNGIVSLDHAAWFHRPARADDWLFYDVQSLVNAGGRGLLRGAMRDPAGRVVVSVAQELRLTPVELH